MDGCGAYIRESWGESLFCGDLNEYREEYCKKCDGKIIPPKKLMVFHTNHLRCD